jgi:hypothetical protein
VRTLVRVIGWALYSDYYGCRVDAQWMLSERRYDVEEYRLFHEKVVFGIFMKLFRTGQHSFYALSRQDDWESKWDTGTEHNYPFGKPTTDCLLALVSTAYRL